MLGKHRLSLVAQGDCHQWPKGTATPRMALTQACGFVCHHRCLQPIRSSHLLQAPKSCPLRPRLGPTLARETLLLVAPH